MLGVIEARSRRSIVIAEQDVLGGLERVMNTFILSQGNLKDIFELQLMLEMGTAELLCARKNPEDIGELEAIVENNAIYRPCRKKMKLSFPEII